MQEMPETFRAIIAANELVDRAVQAAEDTRQGMLRLQELALATNTRPKTRLEALEARPWIRRTRTEKGAGWRDWSRRSKQYIEYYQPTMCDARTGLKCRWCWSRERKWRRVMSLSTWITN